MLDEYTMLLKNGALMTAFAYAGRDVESATDNELNALAYASDHVLSQLGSGWCTYHDACRLETSAYLSNTSLDDFPDPVSRAIEQERREYFESQDTVYESYYILTMIWMPLTEVANKVEEMVYSTDGESSVVTTADKNLETFNQTVSNIVEQMAGQLNIRRLGEYVNFVDGEEIICHELLEHMNFCVIGRNHPVALPDRTMYLDSVIGGYDMYSGVIPMVDGQYVSVVAVDGFPAKSYPTMLQGLDELAVQYRWSNRFIFMDTIEAEGEISKYRKKWEQKKRGWKDQIMQTEKGPVNRDAELMTDDTEQASSEAASSSVVYGYYTSVIVLFDKDANKLDKNASDLRRLINNRGFSARIEQINTVEAWLGSIPGHIDYNLRRPLVSTRNLSDMLPLTSIWAGVDRHECPLYPDKSSALMQCQAAGSTPFRFSTHIGDVGHTLILGPTGAGKSTLLATLVAQQRRYENATIFCFDKKYSMYALCKGMGGTHYDVGSDNAEVTFCPLSAIDTDSEKQWCSEWIEVLCELQGMRLTPSQRNAVYEAMVNLADSPTRSLTEYVATIQDVAIRQALEYYTIDGTLHELVDSETDSLVSDSKMVVFEIEELMNMGDKAVIPVLSYLFHRIEKMLKGQPALLVIDEAWLALGNEAFRDKLREWLKVLRKLNCAVVMATQSPSDLVKSGIADVIVESCLTKILLPNKSAKEKVSQEVYVDYFGLNEAQLDLIASARQKRDYYYLSERGRRVFDLALGPKTLSFVGIAGDEGKKKVDEFINVHGEEKWSQKWLEVHALQ